MKKTVYSLLFAAVMFSACNNQGSQEKTNAGGKSEAALFIEEYTKKYLELYKNSSEAEWASNTKIVEGDSTNRLATEKANKALAAFTGSAEVIEKAKKYLENSKDLSPLEVKQLKKILYAAAGSPQSIPDVVEKLIAAQTKQGEKLYGFSYKIAGKAVTTNDIDGILEAEMDIKKRKEAWEASKEVGVGLKDGLTNLQSLRNQTVQALGYSDYFSYQVSDYGMTSEEMIMMNKKAIQELWDLYRELHTYARYELAKKYKQPVPEYLPAHWLPNRWGQEWGNVVKVEGFDVDKAIKEKGADWLIKQSERFYVSIGFDALPASFYEKSSLYPVDPKAGYKKNNHASAWHMNLDNDVRCLMSVEPNTQWYETTHHELGHIYYYLSYTNPDVPPLMREGANRAFHEGVGSLMGLASMQKPFLAGLGLVPQDAKTDEIQLLLKEALQYVPFVPFGAGVMTNFEHALYAKNLPKDQYNKLWWELVKKYQGIVPPSERGENYCDAATKTHINDDAAQYYDYSMSYMILFQLHDHISNTILKQDPRATNYYGNKEIGTFLKGILYPGATRDWRELMKEKTGSEISAKAMVTYFQPLMAYLKEANKDRKHSLPTTID